MDTNIKEEEQSTNELVNYFRVGTSYYKNVKKPNLSGDTVIVQVPWNFDTIRFDFPKHTKHYISENIQKYDGFCFVPSHVNYQERIGTFLNKYHSVSHKPKKGEFKKIKAFLEHIFNEQIEIGLDYLTILYRYPLQRLPILCLVSNERNTGKSTFLMFLKSIFENNMTINTNEDFRSQFNADWSTKLLIGVDEALLDKKEDSERIKNLSTSIVYKTESKGVDRVEVDFFGKFILCSNNEDNFIIIDPNETRYWVRKISPFATENENLLSELRNEVPYFLDYILNRKISTENKTRMWFSTDILKTPALLKIKSKYKNKAELELWEIIKEVMDSQELTEFSFTNSNAKALLDKAGLKINRSGVRILLEESWKLKPTDNSLTYKTYVFNSDGYIQELTSVGRYYTIKKEKMDEILMN